MAEGQIQEENLPTSPKVSEKSSEHSGLSVGTAPICSPASDSLGVLSGPHTGHHKVDLKQIDCQLFLQQKWVYSVSAKNCSSRSATMVSHVQIP